MELTARLAVTAALVLACLAGSAPAPTKIIFEDDPAWNCTTMGNRGCGLEAPDGTWWVVEHDPTGHPVRLHSRLAWQAAHAS